VHDAARPLASPELAKSVINAVRNGASAAIPALEIVDTMKEVEGSKVLRTLDRTHYVTVQTPQAFRANVLRRAHESGHDATDDATLVEMIGEDVVTVPGERNNIKVTTPDDLVRLNRLMGPEETGPMSKLRIGNGFDMHRFGHRDSHLVLGGINIPHNKSLMGHSDADVLTHAVIDALLGAAGLGDIGHHFPDTDPLWSGADSIEMLRQVVEMLHNQSYHIVNIDVTAIAESPILSPYIVSIQSRLSEVTGGGINVKATSPEGMGALGNEEGIACLASALIVMVA
jgi:2-C-methyl-D-erythritol 2,4-cyclodiphosphate synthase